jgi:hypothetical protein
MNQQASAATPLALFLGAATFAALLWWLTSGDPCLIASLRGGVDPHLNPIAITSCHENAGTVHVTNGDVVVRTLLLAVFMGLFGLIYALIDHVRRKRVIALGAAAGFTIAFLIYLLLLSQIMPGYPPSIFFAFWLVAALVSLLSAGCGAAIAGTTR